MGGNACEGGTVHSPYTFNQDVGLELPDCCLNYQDYACEINHTHHLSHRYYCSYILYIATSHEVHALHVKCVAKKLSLCLFTLMPSVEILYIYIYIRAD